MRKIKTIKTAEGYKVYTGKMRITPKSDRFEPFVVVGEFLYKPEFDCWYGLGSSYPSEICELIDE